MLMTDRSGVKSIAVQPLRAIISTASAACYLAPRLTELLVNRFRRVAMNKGSLRFREKHNSKYIADIVTIFITFAIWG